MTKKSGARNDSPHKKETVNLPYHTPYGLINKFQHFVLYSRITDKRLFFTYRLLVILLALNVLTVCQIHQKVELVALFSWLKPGTTAKMKLYAFLSKFQRIDFCCYRRKCPVVCHNMLRVGVRARCLAQNW